MISDEMRAPDTADTPRNESRDAGPMGLTSSVVAADDERSG
jgi:hypothetical protein